MWQAGCHKSGVHRNVLRDCSVHYVQKEVEPQCSKRRSVLLLHRLISWLFFLNFLGLHVVTRPAIDVENHLRCLALGS